ncbi:extracellular solute-binding protein [Virgibacillus halodenitrificans]|uniref:ABC transporter substrate-binding protein n=1 Tax=Virgibacillus halodenitrificans TaxID=1482 RepID=UPI00136B3050|nr:sugar ABC transporter substrate-binding protein [Virgibacillus halodenitrificans]MYL46704.1 extracellular solute-binding protein [Virgibacillus halodenitrificans]
MKRFLLSFLILGVVLAGCSNKTSSGNSEDDSKEVAGEITVWGWDVAAATFKETVEMFKEEYPDVEVTVEDFGSGDLYEKLTVGLVSKGSGLPDVVLMEDERIPGYVNQFPEGFLNLSEMGYEEHSDLFNDAKIQNVTQEGHLVAAPWDIGPAGVFYRVDLFEEAGVKAEDIETWNDYLEAGIKIEEKTGAKMLPIDISNYDGIFQMMMQQQGLSYFDKDGNLALDTEEAKKSMDMINKFYESDIVLNNSGWDGIVTATVNGDVATVPYGVWYTGTIMDQAPDLKGKWDMFYLPAFEEGGTRYANVGGSSLLIPSYTDNKNAAYAFAEFFTTNDEAQLLGFENYGLFPSLKSTYDSEVLTQNSEFFNDQPIFKNFADIVDEVPKINLTKDYAQVTKVMANTQASILMENKAVDKALADTIEQLKNELKE